MLNTTHNAGVPCLQAALDYAERLHWYVFPCSQEKAPLTPHGFYDATRSREQICSWWRQYPTAAIGIRCGQDSNLTVIDLDTKNGKNGVAEFERLIGDRDLPATWTVKT